MDREREALFSDGTAMFRNPAEPKAGDTVTLRIRAAAETTTEIYLHAGTECIKMEKETVRNRFAYYAAELKLSDAQVTYYYEIRRPEGSWFYDRRGVSQDMEETFRFCITPGFRTPDWAKGAVMYQIFTDRFCNGTVTNDVKTNEYSYINAPVQAVSDWNRLPQAMDVRDFYGGDLQGVWKKLDYLQSLGVEVIYFNPLFVSPSNHKYDAQDYDYIDPHFAVILKDEGECLCEGDTDNNHATKYRSRISAKENLETSNAYFANFVEEVHKRGMKVIIDGVFNHCGSFHKWMDRERIYENAPGYAKGAYISEYSPYRGYFDFRENRWPYNPSYDGWWGHETLPKLNYESSESLCDYVLGIAKKWLSAPYFVDGWRLDVAADLGHSEEFNHSFWKRFRKVVKETNPQALILAEHYGSAKAWLGGDEWDSVMNYDAFMEPVTWFLTGMEKHSDAFYGELLGNTDAFIKAMNYHMAQFQTSSLQVAMNELSNHDHSRFLTRTNQKVGRLAELGSMAASEGIRRHIFMAAVTIQMTWVGAPTVYYGDEAGVCGFTDPDNRRTYPWGNEDRELIRLHKELIRIHRSYPAIRTGSLKIIYAEPDTIAYGRFDEKDVILVIVNRSNSGKRLGIPVWQLNLPDNAPIVSLLRTGEFGFTDEAVISSTQDGFFYVDAAPESSMIWKAVTEGK